MKYPGLDPRLDALLTKLAEPSNSIRQCWGERHDWVKAGCPILPAGKTIEDKDWDGFRKFQD